MVVVPLMWVNQDQRVKWAEHAERAERRQNGQAGAGTGRHGRVVDMACASAIAGAILAGRLSTRPLNRSHVDAQL
jgi:hypothetical protein